MAALEKVLTRPALGLSALVVTVLAPTGTGFPASVPLSDPQSAAIAVTAPHTPVSVPGSDGMHHVEYDLVVTNTSPAPVTLTVVEVLVPDGRPVLRLDGPALAAATQPLDGMTPIGEIPGSAAVAVVIDLRLAADDLAARLTHRLGYESAGTSGDLGIASPVSGPSVAIDPRPPLLVVPPVHGPGWLTANSCCDAFTTHRAGRAPIGAGRFVKTETFAADWIQPVATSRSPPTGPTPGSGSGTAPASSPQRPARSSRSATVSRTDRPTRCRPGSTRPSRPATTSSCRSGPTRGPSTPTCGPEASP